MATVDRHKIEDIYNLLHSEPNGPHTKKRQDFHDLLLNYKKKIGDINDYITDFTPDHSGWEDSVADLFYARVDTLKKGVVQSLNNSIQENGPVDTLEELIDELDAAVYTYIKGIDDPDRPQDISATTNDPFDGAFTSQEQLISDILDKIASIRFDSDVSEMVVHVEPPKIEKQTVTVNQFDRVKVNIGDEVKVMYYLGTDEQGRSYFSETLDDDAPAYSSMWPGQVQTDDAFINDLDNYVTDPKLRYGMNQYRIMFQAANDTSSLTKGKIVHKLPNGHYYNWEYVGGNNGFNESIVFESTYYAPEIVERSDSSYNSSSAFHVVGVGDRKRVSYSSVKNGEVSLFEEQYPDIVLKPGEKIKASYGGFIGLFATNCTLGSDTSSVLLRYDASLGRYYEVDLGSGGYYTSDGNSDANYRSITVEKLMEVSGIK